MTQFIFNFLVKMILILIVDSKMVLKFLKTCLKWIKIDSELKAFNYQKSDRTSDRYRKKILWFFMICRTFNPCFVSNVRIDGLSLKVGNISNKKWFQNNFFHDLNQNHNRTQNILYEKSMALKIDSVERYMYVLSLASLPCLRWALLFSKYCIVLLNLEIYLAEDPTKAAKEKTWIS